MKRFALCFYRAQFAQTVFHLYLRHEKNNPIA